MNSEREIVLKLFESRCKPLEEAEFTLNGKVYKSYFGKYSIDGKPITRQDYFNAKKHAKPDDLKINNQTSNNPSDSRYLASLNSLNDFVETIMVDPVKPDGHFADHEESIHDDVDSREEYLEEDMYYDRFTADTLSNIIETYSGDNEQPKEGRQKELFDDFLDRQPVFYNGGYIYRGMSFKDTEKDLFDELVNSKEGSLLKLRGYTSFSSNPEVSIDFASINKSNNNDNYRVVIVNSRNLTGSSLRAVSCFPSEDEVLYKGDAKLVIKGKQLKGRWLYIHVQEGELQEDDEETNVIDVGLIGTQHIYNN